MTDRKTAFKTGFLRRLASAGIDPLDLDRALRHEKRAAADWTKALAHGAVGYAAWPVALAAVMAGLAGAGAAKTRSTNPADIDFMKSKLVADEYVRGIRSLERQQQTKDEGELA